MSEPEFKTLHIQTDDGLRLYGRDYGSEHRQRLPIVCLAGLSRNSRDFNKLALRLTAENRRVIALDYRGRGLSDWDDKKENYNVGREAQDVINLLDSLCIESAVFIGTSRGGLILHVLGAIAPERIAGLIFNDIGPVIESDGLRRIRDYLTVRQELATFADAAAHLRYIHGAEFPILDPTDWLEMAHALYKEGNGAVTADFDPALVEPLKTIDFSKPLPNLWQQFEALASIPLLVIRGENSKLLSDVTVSEMIKRHPHAHSFVAGAQGHAPLLHIKDVYAGVRAFLQSH
jgi:pimeloyl-ACP methyl ester carboxylesterase